MSTNSRAIPLPSRRAEPGTPIPLDYGTTPGGTIYSSTPGGTARFFNNFFLPSPPVNNNNQKQNQTTISGRKCRAGTEGRTVAKSAFTWTNRFPSGSLLYSLFFQCQSSGSPGPFSRRVSVTHLYCERSGQVTEQIGHGITVLGQVAYTSPIFRRTRRNVRPNAKVRCLFRFPDPTRLLHSTDYLETLQGTDSKSTMEKQLVI